MRGTRVIQLFKGIQALSKADGTTIKELMDVLGRKDKKAAYRLLDNIQAIGVPVYDDKEDGERSKRWKIDEAYRQKIEGLNLPDFTITLPDIIALQLLRSKSASFRGTEIGETLESLFARLDAFVPSNLSLSFKKIEPLFTSSDKFAKEYSGKESILEDVIEAMLNRQTCVIRYFSFQKGKETQFKIDPLSIFEYSGGLYLFVRATTFGDIRMLALERIQAVSILSDIFEEPEDFDPEAILKEPFGLTCDDPVLARIRVSAGQAKYILERPYYRERILKEEADGTITLELNTSGRRDITSWVLSMGDEGELLEPQDLREELAKTLRSTLDKYE